MLPSWRRAHAENLLAGLEVVSNDVLEENKYTLALRTQVANLQMLSHFIMNIVIDSLSWNVFDDLFKKVPYVLAY